MPLTRRRVTEVASLKALAHPLRLALLGALVAEGPMTATEAAALLEESPSNCSWHLRKLAEHGFVREARGGTGRNRPWQAVSEGLEWDSESADPSERLAADALTDMVVERELQRLRAAQASRDREPPAWREATGLSRAAVWLTAAEAREVREQVDALLRTHAERAARPELRPEGSRLTSLVAWVVPSGPHRPVAAEPDDEPAAGGAP
jgi:DNA-binding transcriptional ArsR family regulator